MIAEKSKESIQIKKELSKFGLTESEVAFFEKEINYELEKINSKNQFNLQNDFQNIATEIIGKIISKRNIPPNKKHDFNESSIMGKLGVIILAHYLLKNNICERVINLDDDLTQQLQGYDLIIHLNLQSKHPLALQWFAACGNKKELRIEIKTDAQDYTGNIALEIFSNISIGRKGWGYTSNSDLIFYYFINTSKLHVIETKKLIGLTHFFDSHFSKEAKVFKEKEKIKDEDLTRLDFVFYPKNSLTTFENTILGKKYEALGSPYSGFYKNGQPKQKISRKLLLLDTKEFFDKFGEGQPHRWISKYHSNSEKALKLFTFSYLRVENSRESGDFASLCILFPIETLRLLNMFMNDLYIHKENSFILPENVNFARGGILEKSIREQNSRYPRKQKMDFSEVFFTNMLMDFKNNVASKYLSEWQIQESFLI